ncbi:MAG: DNA internalization-related competence protein ComEC/Rec2 [Pseudohongiellaceae bacterium]
MRLWIIAFCAGLGAVSRLSVLPGWYAPVPVIGILGAILAVSARYSCFTKTGFRRTVVLLIAFLTGATWHLQWAHRHLAGILPAELEGVDFQVEGEVTGLPEARDILQQFDFRITGAEADFAGPKILLNYYGDEIIKPGQRWRFAVRLNRPHGFANPGSFDYEAWLFQRRVSAKGYVRDSADNRLLSDRLTWSGMRYVLWQRVAGLTDNLINGGLMLALGLGDRNAISQEQWQLYSDTGTAHLIVISGLHVGFVAGIFFMLVNRLVRGSSQLLLFFPAQKYAAAAAILAALCYSFLAGFSLPTQRALIMVTVVMGSRLVNSSAPVSFSFCLALWLILLLNPLAVVGAGFWLSFGAVAGLLLVFGGDLPRINSDKSRLKWLVEKWVWPQLVVFLALLVPLAFWMQSLSVLAPVANFIAIPIVSLLVVPLCLAGVAAAIPAPALAALCFAASDWLMGLLNRYLSAVAQLENWPFVWGFPIPSLWIFIAAMLGCLLCLLPRGLGYRYLAVPLLAPLLLPRTASLDAALQLHVLDVGQGLAVIVRTRERVLLYDAGARFSDSFDTGGAVVYPVLTRMGVRRLDRVIISHADNDHAGGFASIAAAMPIVRWETSRPELHDDQELSTQPCRRGQDWVWGGVTFRYLHPGEEETGSKNNSSCVLQIVVGNHRVLLPGDIEASAERRLVRQYGDALRSTVVVAPHHGSNTSSTTGFLAATSPAFVVFSAGYRSQFGHPAAAVRQRYARAGAIACNTADGGMISLTFQTSGSVPDLAVYRRDHRRYWFLSEIPPSCR